MTGEGGTLCLVNGTTYTWKMIYHHSYQMDWNFPSTLPPGGIVRQYVEWTTGTKNWFDDGAEARYQLDGTDVVFEIQARSGKASDGSWDHHLQVYFTNMHTSNLPVGSTVGLGWRHDGQVNWIVAGTAPNNLMTSQPASNWMQANLNILGDRTLRQLCIPSSHDAGMSTLSSHTTDSNINNTLTQYVSIGDQLTAGARWFDVRPVLKGTDYYTGHFSDIGTVAGGIHVGWQGGTGQSINEIINQLNAFTANNKELVIFNLSHAYDTNNGYVDIGPAQWMNLFALLTRINYRYVAPGDPTAVDLTTVPLRQFISGNQAAVLLIVAVEVYPSLGDYAKQGFYYKSQFPFTSTAITKTNYQDVLNSMKNYRPSPDAPCFQLGWAASQGAADAVGFGDTIRDLDEAAMPHLFTDVLPACTSESYPSQLYTDIFNGNVTVLSMAINTLFGGAKRANFSTIAMSGIGIGPAHRKEGVNDNCDLSSTADRAFAIDYNQTGKLDHIVALRPGAGHLWIFERQGNQFSAVFNQPGGIAGYDLLSTADRAFAFDYESTGHLNYLVLYRPGTGAIWIIKVGASPQVVYQVGSGGIGGYDLKSTADRAFAFDYDHSGKLDHIALYRPGTGAFFIVKNDGGRFSAVYRQGDPGTGLGNYDFRSTADRAFAFDYELSGKRDYIAIYRPGAGQFAIMKNTGGTFNSIYLSTTGIAGYNLTSYDDRLFAFCSHTDKFGSIVAYRRARGALFLIEKSAPFVATYAQGDPGNGAGGYNLLSANDRLFAFDYDSSGRADYLVAYRPGAQVMNVIRHI